MTTFITQILNGLQIGAIYALVALGYSMVYGIISLLNFAHGDVIMVGAYIAWFSMTTLGLHPLLSVLLVIILCALLGMGIEKVAYAPLRSAPRLSLLITAIGISYLLENLAQLIFGSGAKRVPKIISIDTIHIGSFDLSGVTLTTLLVSVACTALLTLLVKKTKIGKAMRAVSEDTDTARLMGINANRTISFTFAVGSALAGIGSVLYCSAYPLASPTMGSMLGLKAFVAAVLGGIGSIPGAVLGGVVIGLAETLVTAVGLSTWRDAVTFVILIIVLLVKPSGILGKKKVEKV
ncbi:MAG: branched-chain amino acid ABC transporter permease [Ruminococcus sp.]|nr:branched-chain amino acid ABC transporter permease [Candidatus Apopatosoma intestinale]